MWLEINKSKTNCLYFMLRIYYRDLFYKTVGIAIFFSYELILFCSYVHHGKIYLTSII